MATFRTNHGNQRGRGSGSGFFRSLLLIFIALGLLAILALLIKKDFFQVISSDQASLNYEIPRDQGDSSLRYFLPTGGSGKVVHHRYYALSYREDVELAEWVAYELTRESLALPNVKRTDWFTEDPEVSTESANYHDYKGSGYTRGHLAPAGDMAFNQLAMEESFHMSNISPQKWLFNSGIWRELEENVRDWAEREGRLFVVTGPILNKEDYPRIGRNKVAVPEAYYKILLDADDPKIKAVAFIIPNEKSTDGLEKYMCSVDDAEAKTGLDFFSELLSDDLQQKIESAYDKNKWPVSEKRYQLRINKWNKR